ncbi:MAG: TnpV protein [Oscillospiraceae bacterium]|nr:TnpV protein [Clostridia bacterium]MBQ5318741.1 TnpV protein [Oscillospiraceae bacterium]
MKKSLFENNNLTYCEENGHLVPDVELPEQKEIGAWGLLHLGWLKRFRVARYNELLMSGELNTYLYNVNEEAQERFESLIVDLAESHGLTEELKAKDQMKWVQLANYVAKAAREIVESEVIFI